MPKSKPSVKELEQKLATLTEALLRERADAINVRRRAEEDKAKLSNFYKSLVVEELLPAIDNLARALKHTPSDLQGHDYVKGVQTVANQFEKAFTDMGVERIKTIGEVFDPNLHEAVSVEDGKGDNEIICEEILAGYMVGDNVIRHAMVKVKKG